MSQRSIMFNSVCNHHYYTGIHGLFFEEYTSFKILWNLGPFFSQEPPKILQCALVLQTYRNSFSETSQTRSGRHRGPVHSVYIVRTQEVIDNICALDEAWRCHPEKLYWRLASGAETAARVTYVVHLGILR